MSDPLLSVQGISASYGPIEAVKKVSFNVFEGEIVTMIGSNGAGKSSTLMTVSGILPLQCGSIRFDGVETIGLPAHRLVKLGIAQVPEGRRIFSRLTVLENLALGAYTRSNKREISADLDRVYALFPVLAERRKQPGGTLSGGEQQMLAIARALMTRPRLLLLDEPSMGVAPILAAKIFETIRELNRDGVTVLLVEQNAHLALKLAGRGYVLDNGEMVLSGPTAELLQDPRVRAAYLGEA